MTVYIQLATPVVTREMVRLEGPGEENDRGLVVDRRDAQDS